MFEGIIGNRYEVKKEEPEAEPEEDMDFDKKLKEVKKKLFSMNITCKEGYTDNSPFSNEDTIYVHSDEVFYDMLSLADAPLVYLDVNEDTQTLYLAFIIKTDNGFKCYGCDFYEE